MLTAILILGIVIPVSPTGAYAWDTYRSATPREFSSLASTSVVVDGVQLTLQAASFPNPDFTAPEPGSAIQTATSTAWHPFRELTVTAIPFGHKPSTESLPLAGTGGGHDYAAALKVYRVQHRAQTEDAPAVQLFGKRVTGTRSSLEINVDGPTPSTVVIDEWVVESGKRLWIVRASQEQAADTPAPQPPDFANELIIDGDASSRPSTILSGAGEASSSVATLGPAATTASDLPAASWWNGDCDTNHYFAGSGGIAAYRLGAVYRGMPACGPRPWTDGAPDVLTRFFSGAWGVYEWECVELSMRFLYLAYGSSPYSANGSQVVWNYPGTQLVKVANGTAGQAPQPDDVLSMGATSTWGHTSVVTASNVDNSGNGTITVIEENASSTGASVLSVSGWVVAGNGGTVSGWLHDPSAAGGTNTYVVVHGVLKGTYSVPAGSSSTLRTYIGLQDGPVEVRSSRSIFTSERGFFGPYGTFNEVLGMPNNQLTNHYWFPWYDDKDMVTWVLVGNPSSSQTAHVTIKIAGTAVDSFDLPPYGRATPRYTGVQNGPVEVVSDINVFTSERALWDYPDGAQSFNEVLGYPDNQLTNHYWFPWYDDKDMVTWVLVGNPSSTQTAHVTVKIAGSTVGTYDIPPFGRVTPRYTGVQNGPVEVTSNINVFTSERALWLVTSPPPASTTTSTFNEVMGYPDNQLTNHYWFPWYDDSNMITWVLVGNPRNDVTAHVTIRIAGVVVGMYDVPPFGRVTPRFPGIANGPVEVSSDTNVFTSERALNNNPNPGTSFNEYMGLAHGKLTNDYWFTWYDNKDMLTQLVIGTGP